jgi:mannose-1-phosphate guanylyltransferase / mannose-6-phosphate isomerase
MLVIPVILCGGSGTRLWPLSRKSHPKQFVPIVGENSLLQATLRRLAPLSSQVYCVASEDHRFLVRDELEAAGVQGITLLEPLARNTAAAMGVSALEALKSGNADTPLLFCPSDHFMPDAQGFCAAVQAAAHELVHGEIVTFGIEPTHPATGYGYLQIEPVEASDGLQPVSCFIEKPSAHKASSLLAQGHVLWNAGIFLLTAHTLIGAIRSHAPDILRCCEQAVGEATRSEGYVWLGRAALEACRSQSIDYAVMEHHRPIRVKPLKLAWSDLGSWAAVAEFDPADENGNRAHGQGLFIESQGSYIYSPQRLTVVLGGENLLVIDTPDALMVAPKDMAEQVRKAVEALESRQSPQAVLHRKVSRPWGWYDSLDRGDGFQVKRILVRPGASLSLQLHHHRAEHWVVVRGRARVTRGEEVFELSHNESTYIPLGVKHRLENPTAEDLEIIEIQSGPYLGEDDIVRFEDNYAR